MSNHKALEMFGRSGNPSLSAETFSSNAADASFVTSAPPATMTLQGTVNKTAMLLALVVISASYTWATFFSSGNPAKVILGLLEVPLPALYWPLSPCLKNNIQA